VAEVPRRPGPSARPDIDTDRRLARNGAQTVERAIAVLDSFTHERPEQSVMELSAELELHPSTVRRLLASMEAGGLVERVERSGAYRLGLKVIELAGIALNQRDLVRHCLSELDTLRDQLGLNSNLAVLFQMDVLHLAYAVRSDTPRYYTVIGRRAVAHCTSLGKVLLCELPRGLVHEDIRRRGWRPYTPNSIQDASRLDEELDRVRAQGYAIDEEERTVGTVCVGAPVRDFTGTVIAAISVTGPADELRSDRRREATEQVVTHAQMVSRKLGHIG
jgi:DNA-binding IclR family transcriptional regulator